MQGFTFARLRRSRSLLTAVVAIILFVIYYLLSTRSWAWYNHVEPNTQIVCDMTDEDYESLMDMGERLIRIFDKLHIKYWLVYGSHIGALRYQGPIPWDTDIDLGIEWETLKPHYPDAFFAACRAEGLRVDYRGWGGFFRIENDRSRSDLMLFTDYWGNGWMNRMGIESWLFFINYWTYHIFPAALVRDPLPEYKFGRLQMTSTHDGIQVLKYHYPHDWEREVRPTGCENAVIRKRN
ncbi:hypothetical protein CAOG_04534 [Capsaspora owczarzaki ATCC 30864]|uniref:LicD/FKTN/FKRP nucleotidyltransferase domain-containing protein n=1 Tax=Capsaspora owczarzaki (strain ATCC 30864) TaxID=595528 RepID=A0A0D2WQ98_CAPO3|nr:hypothetical protein CAOG_04534 [Capsaspora owczarzaki ATCC 30864]KJE93790.1 hypothetical protein CAOG_004534 [Capsaspora owczarzaki ATCC 30864]|eukprot:XP_004347281.1 hypothetical protein CAOG_04534 [Capsaspora owczarzaki ATCC 30864]